MTETQTTNSLRNNAALMSLATQIAADAHRAYDNLTTAYRHIAQQATRAADTLTDGLWAQGLGYQTSTEHLEYAATFRAKADDLATLLRTMDRSDELEALIAEPWGYTWN